MQSQVKAANRTLLLKQRIDSLIKHGTLHTFFTSGTHLAAIMRESGDYFPTHYVVQTVLQRPDLGDRDIQTAFGVFESADIPVELRDVVRVFGKPDASWNNEHPNLLRELVRTGLWPEEAILH